MKDLEYKQITDLKISSESHIKELLNTCFSFEINSSYGLLKITVNIGEKPKANVHGAKGKMKDLD